MLAGSVLLLLEPSLVQAAAAIRMINRDGPGEGLNDPTPAAPVGGNSGTTLGAQRLIVVEAAARVWAELIESSVEIRVGMTFDELACDFGSVTLGIAGPNNAHRDFAGAPREDTFYPDALADSLAGMDLCPPDDCADSDDISATFNSAFGTTCEFEGEFYHGLDGAAPSGDPDLFTTVLHELGHGLGFITFVNLRTGAKFRGGDDAYMFHLQDNATGKTFPEMSNSERVDATTAAGDLRWVGPAVVAASSRLTSGADAGGNVEMYAPLRFSAGASVSHFSNGLLPDELMEPFDNGPILTVGLALELFADLGWQLASDITPTPTSTQAPSATRTRAQTATRTRTATRTPVPGTPTPTFTKVPPDTCLGDCNGDDAVSIDELIMGVRIALGVVPLWQCGAFDPLCDGSVSIADLTVAVDHALERCPEPAPRP